MSKYFCDHKTRYIANQKFVTERNIYLVIVLKNYKSFTFIYMVIVRIVKNNVTTHGTLINVYFIKTLPVFAKVK